MDAGGSSCAQNRAQDLRKHVQVLVGIDVGETQPEALKQGDLRCSFGFDFGRADSCGVEPLQVGAERG